MRAWEEGRPLLELLRADPEVTAVLPADDLAPLFDLGPPPAPGGRRSSSGCSGAPDAGTRPRLGG
jgi:hypothetical protein